MLAQKLSRGSRWPIPCPPCHSCALSILLAPRAFYSQALPCPFPAQSLFFLLSWLPQHKIQALIAKN